MTTIEGPRVEIPADLVAKSWPILTTDFEVRAPFESEMGWVQLVAKRDVRSAVEKLGPKGGFPAARAHMEAATMYRQAVLLVANALIQTYGETPQETDPIGAAHLLAMSYSVLGDLEKARAQQALLEGVDDPSGPWNAPWKAWLAQENPTWPPDLSALPFQLPEKRLGLWPDVPAPPHYQISERVEEARLLDVGDPATLLALALWHDAVARSAVTDNPEIADLFGARYRLPVEVGVASTVEMPLEMTFGSDYLVPADALFLAAIQRGEVAGAVDEFKGTSLIAALCAESQVDGKIDSEKAIDMAAEVRKTMLATMKEKAGGNVEDFHRTFADIAHVAVLRGMALVAEAQGERETSGRLRINALEKSGDEPTSCPSALLSMAAWDANNRYPLRGTEILHNLIRRFPSLESARFGLEVLALRVSREQGPATPGQ